MDTSSVISKLFNNGNYGHILVEIFSYLDGPSLEACHLVSKQWRGFLLNYMCGEHVQKRLKQSFKTGVASTRRIQLSGRFLSMKCDNTSMLVGLEAGHMELWERVGNSYERNNYTGWRSPKRRLSDLSGHTDLVKAVDMSPKWLASGSWDSGVRLWSRKTGECVAQAYHHTAPVTGIVLNEIEGWIISSSRDFRVRRVWIKEDKDHVKLVEDPDFVIYHTTGIIDISMDGNFLLSGCNDSRVLYWKLSLKPEDTKFDLVHTLTGHGNGIRCVYLKGRIGLSGSRDRTAKIWNLEDGTCIRSLPHSIDVRAVTMNSTILMTGDDYPDVYMWDLKACLDPEVEDGSCKLLLRTLTGHNGLVHSIQCTPTGIVTCDVTGLVIERDYWNCVQEGPSLRILRCDEGVNCMVVDETAVAVGLLNKVANLYDRKSLKLIHSMTGHSDHIWSIDMNKKHIVTGSWDATVNVWLRSTGEKVFRFRHPHEREISSVKLARDRVYISSLSGGIAVLKETPEVPEKFDLELLLPNQKELGEIYSMDVDDTYILTGHTYTSTSLQLWSLKEVVPLKVIRENTSESIVWNLHLAYPLTLVCRDNEILDIYHLESQTCLKSLRHQSKVLNASLFRGIVIVGCQYGLLAFWNLHEALKSAQDVVDINHASCVKILAEHSGAISNISIDNDELITDDYDGVVIFRKMKKHSHLKQIFNTSNC